MAALNTTETEIFGRDLPGTLGRWIHTCFDLTHTRIKKFLFVDFLVSSFPITLSGFL